MPTSGEFDITKKDTAVPAEPEPGTPAFGERAKARIGQIAAPAPEDLPTAAELAGAAEAAPPDLGGDWTNETPDSGTAGPGSQGDLASSLNAFDVPAPVLAALLHDNTPVDAGDPEGDIIKRLTDSLLNDNVQIPQPRGFTPGEHLALGLMGALDGEIYQSVVLPMLMAEREAPRQAALDMAAAQQRRLQSLQALSSLMEARRVHQETEEGRRENRALTIAQMQMNAMEQNANRRLQIFLAGQRAAKKNAAAQKIPDRIMGTYTLAVIAHQDAMAMKKLLDNNKSAIFGEPGGPVAGMFGGVGPGGDVRAQISALAGTVNESIMMITQRRGLNKETQRKIGGSLPDIKQSSETLRKSIETAIRTTGQFISGTEVQYPNTARMKAQMIELLEKSKGDPEAISAIVQDPESWLNVNGLGGMAAPGHENGDVDLNLWLDDDEVNP